VVVIRGCLAVECWVSVVSGGTFLRSKNMPRFLNISVESVSSESGLSFRILAARGNGPKAYLSTGPSVVEWVRSWAVVVERFEELG